MEVVSASFSSVTAVHVVGFRDCPLAIIQRLLGAGHHLTEEGSKGAGPLYRRVREERSGLGQATGIHSGDEVVDSFREQHYRRAAEIARPGAILP